MTLLTVILLIFSSIISLLIGTFVLARDWRKDENKAFFGISVGIAAWAIGIAGFIHTDSLSSALMWAKFYYLAPLLIVFSSVIFAKRFLHGIKLPAFFEWFVGLSVVLLALFLLLQQDFMTSSVVYREYGKQVLLNPFHYSLYAASLLVCFVLTISMTFGKMRRARYKVARQQVKTFLVGYTVSCILGVYFNLLLPGVGDYSLITVGPLCTTVFLSATAYAIIKHKLFDIRAVVTRSIVYVLSLLVLAAVYGLVVFGIATYVFDLRIPVATQIYLSVATGLAALAFQNPIKIFDRKTNRIFYRDAYDPQELFDDLNQAQVSSLNLNTVLKQVSEILIGNLKSEYVNFAIKIDVDSHRLIGLNSPHSKVSIKDKDLEAVYRAGNKARKTVIVTDYIEEEHESLKRALTNNNIAVLVRLTQDPRKYEEGLGYIMLGQKKSGNPYGSQDVRVLEAVANGLIITIQNALHYEEIQRFNLTLQQRVEEATRQLKRTNAKLEALDETKDDFISMASHQLRTPLTSVKGYISMVLDGDAGKVNPTQRKMLNQAFISSQRMVYLIADLLNVSRLKTGKFIIEPTPTNLAKLITEEVGQLIETAASRNIKLSYDRPAHFPLLNLDETKTRQVIMNFVDNAIYYTPSGGHITVSLIEKPSAVELRVKDDGIGVPASEQHHLFTKFYRARNAQKARPDGTGLGLFMAKKVIAAQGGAIVFESKEGKGSTFGFTFSKTKLAVPETTPDTSSVTASAAL